MLEMLHAKDTREARATGMLVANDADSSRAYMLVHQCKRHASEALIVTTHAAQVFPKLEKKFDRVLADVPCSGDGTMRKSPLIWKTWTVRNGAALFPLQHMIARRGAQMLAIGGRMVYSTCRSVFISFVCSIYSFVYSRFFLSCSLLVCCTCSLNPIEDEAVVAKLLRGANGALELVDVSEVLPQLRRCNGKSTWKVCNRKMEWFDSIDDVPHDQIGNGKVLKTEFKIYIFKLIVSLELCRRVKNARKRDEDGRRARHRRPAPS